MSRTTPPDDQDRPISTGIAALDDVLGGGLPPERLYLIEGTPGAGKTTLAMQFLMHGVAVGEPGLYVTLSETKTELTAVARSHGWSLEGLEVFELVASEEDLEPENQYTMFQPSELELTVTTKAVLAQVERTSPRRLVFDSLSELRLLAQNPLRYRRQILALKQFFAGRNCTVLLLDDKTARDDDLQLQSIAHGVLTLEQLSPDYGAERRRLRVTKLRGQRYRGGYHDFTIRRGGLDIFPRLVAAEHPVAHSNGVLSSGSKEIDALLGGGVERGTSVLLLGPAGVGKSSLAAQYAVAAAGRGERAALFVFDESVETTRRRAAGLGMDMDGPVARGLLTIQQVDPAELSPGEFAHAVRDAVEPPGDGEGARVVVVDSLNGYLNAMPEERHLTAQLHELLAYLGHRDVVSFLVVAQHGVLGHVQTPIDTTYLADAVLLFRYFESEGAVRQALSVVKKRTGAHERTIRELRMDDRGLHVGPPLREFRGVLTGVPAYVGAEGPLMGRSDG